VEKLRIGTFLSFSAMEEDFTMRGRLLMQDRFEVQWITIFFA
jgi:hypothetical protein